MYKLILSIIAVACLQIGFITYVTSDRTVDNEGLTGLRTQDVGPQPNPDYLTADESIEVASLDDDPFFRRDAGAFRDVRTARAVRADHRIRRKNTRVARKPRTVVTPFEPEQVIITYAVQKPYKFAEREPYKNISVYNEPIVNKAEVADHPVQKSEKSDGNPILNVIKKPYAWIKALGSRLK